MANLRLTDIKVYDNVTVKALFTDKLSPLISNSNIEIVANSIGIPNPTVLFVTVSDNLLTVTTQPMTPYGSYFITFKSNDVVKFKSLNGQNFLFEDGKTNVALILGAEDPDNKYRNEIVASLTGGIYDLSSPTLIRTFLNCYTSDIKKAASDIGQMRSDNYLSNTIVDEQKTRGSGPYDRLNEEGAYEVSRVGKTKTGATLVSSINFAAIPSGPITLQRVQVLGEKLTAGYGQGTFNNFILNVSKNPVTKLNAVDITYSNGAKYSYDIRTYGYQAKDPKYDQNYASTYLLLEDSQFQLSADVMSDVNFRIPAVGDSITVSYEYKSLGTIIDDKTVTLTQINSAIREITPPLQTQFSLKNAVIVNASDNILSSGGISFLDPSAYPPFSTTHPAFKYEIPLRYDGLPSSAGQFAVDYTAGKVYVYGAVTNDGTGNLPPVASYKYRKYFVSDLDYTYDSDTRDFAVNPLRNVAGQSAKIDFGFQNALVPGIDYVAQKHTEVLDERIQNRIPSSNSVNVKNTPITNVFRIYNETSGEVYKLLRFNDNTVYFEYITPPSLLSANRERASFTNVLNELLITNSERINTLGTRVLTILLQNNRIMASTEDVIGSSYNSSISFSKSGLFDNELFYDSQELTTIQNTNRLLVGQYQVDYKNGIVYIGVNPGQGEDLGTISYKNSVIAPQNTHVVAVSEIYSSLSFPSGINKTMDYVNFSDGAITPVSLDYSDERFLNGDPTLSYFLISNTIAVTDDIKDIRGIYDAYDLNNNYYPTNFSPSAIFDANIITLSTSGIQKTESYFISSGNNIVVNTISPGIEIAGVTSVIRLSDSVQLWDQYGTFVNNTISLGSSGLPATGQAVVVIYSVKLNASCTPIIDYNRGDCYIDYSYLADEILVSYEHGDNCLDFRQSDAISKGETYYVTYKSGALRDALLKNFGTLVNISILNSFDTSLPRENYRDILTGALQSFTKGPTIPALKSIVSNITKIEPEIIEEAFQQWSLGVSYLQRQSIKADGALELMPAKFDYGVLVDKPGECVSFPVSSNLRLEEGTLETWVIPEWDGLDNDATITFSNVKRDGNYIDRSNIYIGSGSLHPTIFDNKFSLNKKDLRSTIGLPSAIHTKPFGIFIYYDDVDKRWNVLAKDVNDGISEHIYTGQINTSGEMYDVKFIETYGKIDDVLRSGNSKIEYLFKVYDGYLPDAYSASYAFDGITFMSDDLHYLFDFGHDEHTDRFSIFKDGKGYLNFEVFDSGNYKVNKKSSYKVSADISNWKAGEKHHIATSWVINSSDQKDELHLFIDGFEVPNIIRYGGRPTASSSDRFRSVKPEIVVGTVPKNTFTCNDMATIFGSTYVASSSIDFQDGGIVAGDTVYIKETSFGTYNVVSVDGYSMELDSPMPATLSDARFSVNPYSVTVASEIDLSSNIAVSIIHDSVETEIAGVRAPIPDYEIYKNLLNQNILTILGDAKAGDTVVIRTLGLNHKRARSAVYQWGDTNSILKTQMPSPINLDSVKIIPVLIPLCTVGPANSTLAGLLFTSNVIFATQPSNDTDGRTLSVRVAGGNIDFTTPAQITIIGTNISGPVTEILIFTSASTQQTSNKFATITSVVMTGKTYDASKVFTSIEMREAYSVTYSENNASFPVIRFSYKKEFGTNLSCSGTSTVTDNIGVFFDSDIGSILQITYPPSVVGTYTITARADNNNITVSPTPPASFTGGSYDIYNTTIGRSGFQNGFFFLEKAGSTNVPYPLKQGVYELDFPAYLSIPFSLPKNTNAFIGSDINATHQAKAVIDEFRILSKKLTDTRVGETIAEGDYSVTTDCNSLRKFVKNSSTLMLIHFDEKPFINDSDVWIYADRNYIQSSSSVNENFGQSLVIKENPIVIDNKGILTNNEGTVEFWVSPKYDTYNDPEERYYFDSASATVEESTSLTGGTVKASGRVNKVLSVRLASDKNNTGIEYFDGGHIGGDYQTIYLKRQLPYQKVPVIITYIPSGLVGERLSIFKDRDGFITFRVEAKGKVFETRQPIFWPRNTWHRVRITFKFNRKDNQDEIRLFIDGEERGIIRFGTGILFSSNYLFGQNIAGISNQILIADINFTDTLNKLFIGSDYLKSKSAMARFDNIKISNIAKLPLAVSGQPKDINYSSNLSVVYPTVEDVYTTYLANFDTLSKQANDFALLKSSKYGSNNFTVNVIDSFNIVSGSDKIKQILEILIDSLKPAQTISTIKYVK